MTKTNKDRGQGLVETALLLPFLLVLLVGLVELGVALNRQITVVNAAREGARFGAAGAAPDDIHEVVLSGASQMMDFNEDNMVIVIIQAETNEDGTDFARWVTTTYPEGAAAPHVTLQKLLAELQGDSVELVIVDVEYDHEAILGLPFVSALMGRIPVGSWTAMRLEELGNSRETPCCVYPIALEAGAVEAEMEDVRIGEGEGAFGWLYWDPDKNGDAAYLGENMANPCRAGDEFRNACDPADTALGVGDWVSGVPDETVPVGVGSAITEGQYIRFPLWDRFETCGEIGCGCKPGSQAARVAGFVVVEVTGMHLTGSPKTISARFVRTDEGCQ